MYRELLDDQQCHSGINGGRCDGPSQIQRASIESLRSNCHARRESLAGVILFQSNLFDASGDLTSPDENVENPASRAKYIENTLVVESHDIR
jgi:hypothetical protein